MQIKAKYSLVCTSKTTGKLKKKKKGRCSFYFWHFWIHTWSTISHLGIFSAWKAFTYWNQSSKGQEKVEARKVRRRGFASCAGALEVKYWKHQCQCWEGKSAHQGSSIAVIKEHINCSAFLGIGSSQLNAVVGFATHCDFIIPPEFLQKMWNSIRLYETSPWNLL